MNKNSIHMFNQSCSIPASQIVDNNDVQDGVASQDAKKGVMARISRLSPRAQGCPNISRDRVTKVKLSDA